MKPGQIWGACLFLVGTFVVGTVVGAVLMILGALVFTLTGNATVAADARVKALREAARYLRGQGFARFDEHGAHDARGAALWDAGCAIDPHDGNALGAKAVAR